MLSYTQGSKFIFSHIATYVVAINMIDIVQVLRKQTDKVCVFSYRLAWKLKVINVKKLVSLKHGVRAINQT